MKIGFIGTGNFAQQHAEILQSLGATITACYGTNPEKTTHFAEKFNCTSFKSSQTLISKQHIDALYIVIPPFAHDGNAELQAINENIPFFCEKPVGLNIAQCEQISRQLKKSNSITSSGYLLRYEPLFEKIKTILNRNTISTVRICSYSYMPQVHWWRDHQKSGGMMVESGSHYIDLLRFLFGEISNVNAIASQGIAKKIISDCNTFDSMEAIIKFDNGIIGSIGVTHLLNKIKARQDRLEIYGQDFALQIDLYKLRYQQEAAVLYKESQDDKWVEIRYPSSKKELLIKENQAFLQSIRTQDLSLIKSDYCDAVKTLKVALAMNEASLNQIKGSSPDN